mgnify:CR=1 FL=1
MNRIPGYMLRQTASYRGFLGTTAHGPSYATTTTMIRCRIEPKRTLFRTQDGSDIAATARLYAFPEAPLAPQGLVEFAGITYEVLAVDRVPGRNGSIHHLECLLK